MATKRVKKNKWLAWAIREAVRTDFLVTKDEILHYISALYLAAAWGEKVR